MNKEKVIFKGSKEGIIAIMDATAPFKEVLGEINDKLVSSTNFFSGMDLKMCFRGREISSREAWDISKLVRKIAGGNVIVKFGEQNSSAYTEVINVSDDANKDGMAKFHRGTVRSGQIIKAPGHLVVMGDINPGSQIMAGGNIIVAGSLKGVAYAGCDGDRRSIIAAFNMCPTQLAIADIITRPPDDQVDIKYPVPEVAYVKDGQIYIDTCMNKKGVMIL